MEQATNTNCAWCNPGDPSASHGICDDCIERHFHVDPKEIHLAIQAEAEQQQQPTRPVNK